MTNAPIREPEHIRQDAAEKLRLAQLSGALRATMGCLLEQDWTTPRVIEMLIAPDGQLLGRLENEEYFAGGLGQSADLLKCVRKVAKAANLDGDEVGYLLAKVAEIQRLK